MRAFPERNAVEFLTQQRSGVLRNQHLLGAQAAAGIDGKLALLLVLLAQFRKRIGLVRVGLFRNQQPDIGFGKAGLDDFVGLFILGARLAALEGIEVELFVLHLLLDGLPGEVLAHALL